MVLIFGCEGTDLHIHEGEFLAKVRDLFILYVSDEGQWLLVCCGRGEVTLMGTLIDMQDRFTNDVLQFPLIPGMRLLLLLSSFPWPLLLKLFDRIAHESGPLPEPKKDIMRR